MTVHILIYRRQYFVNADDTVAQTVSSSIELDYDLSFGEKHILLL